MALKTYKTKKSTTLPAGIPSRVFTIEFHADGITNRINAMGYNIACVETKLDLSQLVEEAFKEFLKLKKVHT